MIQWLLKTLGVENEHPEPVGGVNFRPTDAEFHFERVRQGAEWTIRHADMETARTERATQELRFPLEGVRWDDDA